MIPKVGKPDNFKLCKFLKLSSDNIKVIVQILFAVNLFLCNKWVKVFKNKPKNIIDHITSGFLKAVFHKFYLVHSWISWPKYSWFLALCEEFSSFSPKMLVTHMHVLAAYLKVKHSIAYNSFYWKYWGFWCIFLIGFTSFSVSFIFFSFEHHHLCYIT